MKRRKTYHFLLQGVCSLLIASLTVEASEPGDRREGMNALTHGHRIGLVIRILQESASPQRLFQHGLEYKAAGECEKAVELFTAAINLGERTYEILLARGECHYELARYREALDDVKVALSMKERTPQAYLLQGNTLAKLRLSKELIESLSRGLDEFPAEKNSLASQMYMMRGVAYMADNAYEKAAKDLEKAFELGLRTSWIYYYRGMLETYMGHYEAAISDYSNAVMRKPDHYKALLYRGTLRVCLDKVNEGIQDFDAVLALRPSDSGALLRRGWAKIELGQLRLALADLLEAERQGAKDALVYAYLADVYYKLEKYEEGLRANTKAMELSDPELKPSLYYQKGLLLLATGHSEEALVAFRAGKELAVSGLIIRGMEKAIDELREAVEAKENARAVGHSVLRELDEARTYVERSAKRDYTQCKRGQIL